MAQTEGSENPGKMVIRLLWLLPVIGALLLAGCGKEEPKPVASGKAAHHQQDKAPKVSMDDIRPSTSAEFDCTDTTPGSSEKRLWCMGLKDWQASKGYSSTNNAARDDFIGAWKIGLLDALQANTPALESLRNNPVAADGYEAGYIAVVNSQGIVEYDCSGQGSDNEYRDRWCEASKAYSNNSEGSPSNLILRNNYINGFMSGKAIALTMPTSMDSLLGGTPAQDGKQAIDEPPVSAPRSQRIFFTGFNSGYQAMVDTVRESVNQVMEQMQNLQGMQGMEGMPPGMPGMDGMPSMDNGSGMSAPPPGMPGGMGEMPGDGMPDSQDGMN